MEELEAALKWAETFDTCDSECDGYPVDEHRHIPVLAAHIRAQSSELARMKAVVEVSGEMFPFGPEAWLSHPPNVLDASENKWVTRLAQALAALKKAQEKP
jgi:hypothetical protein